MVLKREDICADLCPRSIGYLMRDYRLFVVLPPECCTSSTLGYCFLDVSRHVGSVHYLTSPSATLLYAQVTFCNLDNISPLIALGTTSFSPAKSKSSSQWISSRIPQYACSCGDALSLYFGQPCMTYRLMWFCTSSFSDVSFSA